MINLEKKYLTILLDILNAHMSEYAVWLFGSRATNHCKPFSDIDIAVIASEKIDENRIAKLKYALSESNLPYKIDIVEFSTVDTAFQAIIQNKHIVLKKEQ